jgi:hypothetical protein
MKTKPYLIQFSKHGDTSLGYISVAEGEIIPFSTRRIYWTYYTPQNVERGGHAHIELEQILVAVAGEIDIKIELKTGELFYFKLNNPSIGLYLPKLSWREMKYSHNSVQMCLASLEYSEDDYIRDYNNFREK